MVKLQHRVFLSCIVLLAVVVRLEAASQQQVEFFESRIRPIFATNCQPCHGPKLRMAGLDLLNAAGFRKGPDDGPLFDPADLDNSRLLKALSYQERVKMPPSGKLRDEQIAAIREWLRLGAPWPDDPTEPVKSEQPEKHTYARAGKDFWSFQAVKVVTPPEVKHRDWVRTVIDRFILAKLEEKGLEPSPPADKLTLIRRATLDLTGLTPTESEIRDFLHDESADAFAKLVDRLLASPRYGERWGRHWLDVARYGDSTGEDEDYRYPYAWRYRDYVIGAFNRDLPYHQFVKEQLAGDLLPAGTGSPVNVNGIIATGFVALGPKLIAESDKTKSFYDIVDEEIDVTGKAFLGLTVACARCHDHKFDPILTKDYYALASIFASTKQFAKLEGIESKLYFAPLVPREEAERYEGHQKKIERKQAEIDRLTEDEGRRYRNQLAPRLAAYMLAARRIYAEGAAPLQVASEAALDREVLQRWVEYLKPTKERRVHLEPWYQADLASLERVAHSYQDSFIAVATERDRAMVEWELKAAAAWARGEEPPERPKFEPENRFYTEVTTTGAKDDAPRPSGPFALPDKDSEKLFTEDARAKMALLKEELEQLKKSGPPEPAFACGLAEGKIIDQPVFLHGNPDAKGEIVPKRFPIVLAGDRQPPIAHGSGRLELANWLADPQNPLPARVMVNRIWQWHFGEGIVRTPSNFGMAGERPTHPELLDYLASRFVAGGWSVKAMHRLIMLSSTYQMSSEATAEKRQQDPDNLLWSRFRMRRLDVEEIRDSLLWFDGSLDLSMGGTLQKGFGTDIAFSEDRKSFNPDESKRRMVYLPLRRSNLPSLLNLFDFGDATTSNEARMATNVAPRALYMMNSKFVFEQTKSLATKLLAEESDETRRLERAWLLVVGRPPSAAELDDARRYIAGYPGKPDDREGRLLAWSSLCRALVASNDFIYVH
jgi:mono/diheme cytochrome c family protein